MDPETKERISDRTIWARGLYALFFVIAYSVAETILWLLAIFQFIAALVTGHVNDALLRFGANLSHFIFQILQFVSFNDETLPFPFSDWPDEEPTTKSAWVKTNSSEVDDLPNEQAPTPAPTVVADEPQNQVEDAPADDISSDPTNDEPGKN